MGDIYEVDQKGQIQDIVDEVTNVRADQTPFTSLVPKGKKPAQKLTIFQMQDIDDLDIDGVVDGEDVSEFGGQAREEGTAVAQKFRKPWKVSDFADVTDLAGLESEKANQKAIKTVQLKFAMEGRFLSNLDCAKQPAAAKNVTRGAFSWVSNTAQALYPVPEAFRPASACNYASTVALFTEAALEALGQAAYQDIKGMVDWDAFVGITLQNGIDNFTKLDPTASTTAQPVRVWTQNAEKKAFVKVVQSLTFSWGTIRCHPSTFLAKNLAGTDSAYTHRSALFLAMKHWRLRFMRKPRMVDLPDLGGGPRGFADAIAVLCCLNPKGQASALCSE